MMKIGRINLDECSNTPIKSYKHCKPASIKIKTAWPKKVKSKMTLLHKNLNDFLLLLFLTPSLPSPM